MRFQVKSVKFDLPGPMSLRQGEAGRTVEHMKCEDGYYLEYDDEKNVVRMRLGAAGPHGVMVPVGHPENARIHVNGRMSIEPIDQGKIVKHLRGNEFVVAPDDRPPVEETAAVAGSMRDVFVPAPVITASPEVIERVKRAAEELKAKEAEEARLKLLADQDARSSAPAEATSSVTVIATYPPKR